ncbi:MAG: DNRLRE domain-containing protein [Saprospiraceae bacterium]
MKYILIVILFSNSSLLLSQTTITLQPDGNEGKDAKIFSLDALATFGDDLDFIAATWTFGGEAGTLRSIIQFDLSSIPPGAGILDARLSLFHNNVSQSAGHAGNNAAYLRRITEPWNESMVNWSSQPAYTTLDQIYLPESTSSEQDYENINVAPLIRDMIANPTQSFGFMFMLESEAVLHSMKFGSSDLGQPTRRPKLEITYSTNPVECITLQPATEGKDAKVFSLSPQNNFGNDEDLIAATWTFGGSDGTLRGLMEFDLSSLPQNVLVTNAALSLYYNTTSASAGQDGSNSTLLQRITEPWNEQTVNWNNQPATTNAQEVILPESTSMSQDYTEIDVTGLIQDILANPATSHGIMLKQIVETAFRSMKFASSDHPIASDHPKLEVCYTTTTATQDLNFKKISIWPNPFQNSFQMLDLAGKYFIKITDVSGTVFYSATIESNHQGITIDKLDDIPPGIYFISAIGSSGNYLSKIVKTSE